MINMTIKSIFSISAKQVLVFISLFSAHVIVIAATKVPDSQAERGKQLYTDNCAICHGHNGTGGVGIPLGLEDFLAQTPDEYLHRTIRVGRPGRIMPSFYRLSDAEIKAIISHIRSWKKTTIPAWDGTRIRADAARGKQLFEQYCISCHGKEGRGGKGTGMMFSRPRDLPIAPPALNNQGFLNSVSDQMLKNIITHGRKQTPMPAASEFKLGEKDVENLVSYIRSFQKTMMSGEQIIDEPPILSYTSKHSYEETLQKLKQSVIDKNYEIKGQTPLDYGFVDKSQESKTHMMMNFCNYEIINEALEIDPRIGMFLPCRITVTETDGYVRVMSINPKRLSQLFNNDELDKACEGMYETYSQILQEATQ